MQEDGRRLNAQIQGGGVTVDKWYDVKGCTPLVLAAYKRHDTVVARLLALGADVGLRNALGDQAAHWACRGASARTLRLLLDAGAAFNERNKAGYTPLTCAALQKFWYGATACVKLLLRRGGAALELDAQENYGWTALHLVARDGFSPILKLLLHAGADPTIRNNNGCTPLAKARLCDNHSLGLDGALSAFPLSFRSFRPAGVSAALSTAGRLSRDHNALKNKEGDRLAPG